MWNKILEFFKKILNKEKIKEIGTVEIENHTEISNMNSSFMESIKVNDNTNNMKLIQKISNKEMKIEDLTDIELDSLLLFYKNKFGLQN